MARTPAATHPASGARISVRATVPFEASGASANPNNLPTDRTDKGKGAAAQELTSWSPIGVDGVPAAVSFHVPHKFGVLVLDL